MLPQFVSIHALVHVCGVMFLDRNCGIFHELYFPARELTDEYWTYLISIVETLPRAKDI